MHVGNNTISYIVPPEINLQLADMTENETNNVDFVCRAVGDPAPNIIWYFNGAMIDLSNTAKYHTSVLPLGQDILSFFLLIDAESSDVGTYTCQAVNIVGTDESSSILTVNGTYKKYCIH